MSLNIQVGNKLQIKEFNLRTICKNPAILIIHPLFSVPCSYSTLCRAACNPLAGFHLRQRDMFPLHRQLPDEIQPGPGKTGVGDHRDGTSCDVTQKVSPAQEQRTLFYPEL